MANDPRWHFPPCSASYADFPLRSRGTIPERGNINSLRNSPSLSNKGNGQGGPMLLRLSTFYVDSPHKVFHSKKPMFRHFSAESVSKTPVSSPFALRRVVGVTSLSQKCTQNIPYFVNFVKTIKQKIE